MSGRTIDSGLGGGYIEWVIHSGLTEHLYSGDAEDRRSGVNQPSPAHFPEQLSLLCRRHLACPRRVGVLPMQCVKPRAGCPRGGTHRLRRIYAAFQRNHSHILARSLTALTTTAHPAFAKPAAPEPRGLTSAHFLKGRGERAGCNHIIPIGPIGPMKKQ